MFRLAEVAFGAEMTGLNFERRTGSPLNSSLDVPEECDFLFSSSTVNP
jgi:hypothetical protein